jgi:threonine/homoserine/homoserine lactone efflux protein
VSPTELLIAFVGVQMLATLSPGPAFLVVSRNSLQGGRSAGLATAMACALGVFIWLTATMAGIELLLSRFVWLHTALQLAGGMFLIYLAVEQWRHAGDPLPEVRAADAPPKSALSYFGAGLLVQLGNPKALAYCVSVLIVLVPPQSPLWVKIAVPLIGTLIEALWWSALALAFSQVSFRQRYGRLKGAIDRVIGVALGGLAVRLLADRS